MKSQGAANGALFELPSEIKETIRAGASADLSTVRVSAGTEQYSCRVFVMNPQNGTLGQSLLAIHLKRERSLSEAIRRVGPTYHLTRANKKR